MSQDSRTAMIAALSGRQPETAVPIWELHFHLWDKFSAEPYVVGAAYAQLTSAEQQRALQVNAEIMVAVAEELHFAAVTIPDRYWELAPGVTTYYWLPDEDRYALAERIARLAGDRLMVVASAGGVLGMPPPQTYVEFCYQLYDAPEEVDQLARETYQAGVDCARRMRDVGVEAVYAAADLADNHGPFYKPAFMDRFVTPYMNDWAAAVKQMGLYAIFHTDGDIYPILDAIVASGMHALQAIDPIAGMDIVNVKSLTAGKICLCGNVDCGLLIQGPAEAVYASTRDLLLACKPGGAFILGASNAVMQETPPEHYLAMIRAWQEFGAY